MTYAKLVNGEIQFAPNPIHVGGNLIGNPPADLMLSIGWKTVVFSEPPESDYPAEPEWVEKDSEIVQTWVISASGSVSRIREWVQPSGANDAYGNGDFVSHNGFLWESTADANVWEPGVYGWKQKGV